MSKEEQNAAPPAPPADINEVTPSRPQPPPAPPSSPPPPPQPRGPSLEHQLLTSRQACAALSAQVAALQTQMALLATTTQPTASPHASPPPRSSQQPHQDDDQPRRREPSPSSSSTYYPYPQQPTPQQQAAHHTQPPSGTGDAYGHLFDLPLTCQRRTVRTAPGQQHTHFFPLELTDKDYLRRLLDIVASGIRGKIVALWVGQSHFAAFEAGGVVQGGGTRSSSFGASSSSHAASHSAFHGASSGTPGSARPHRRAPSTPTHHAHSLHSTPNSHPHGHSQHSQHSQHNHAHAQHSQHTHAHAHGHGSTPTAASISAQLADPVRLLESIVCRERDEVQRRAVHGALQAALGELCVCVLCAVCLRVSTCVRVLSFSFCL